MTIWKPIKNYEKIYEISKTGKIKSLKRKWITKELILKPRLHWTGYLMIGLRKRKQGLKFFRVHRLVAEHFIENKENKKYVNHKNGIKTDNRVKNLEWVTGKENSKHAWKTGLIDNRGEKMGWSKLKRKQVLEIRQKYMPRKYSTYKLAKEYRVSYGTINAIINNRIWRDLK